MRRRALLAAVGATTAGCLGGPGAVPGGSNPSTERPPPDEPGARFRVTDFAVSTAKVHPEKRYLVRVTHTYSAEAVADEPGDQTVRDVTDVSDSAVRDALKAVLREGKVWRDEIPDGLREATERVDFFTWGATTDDSQTDTHWRVAVYRAYPDRPAVIEVDAALVDDEVSPDDPATLALSVTNTGDEARTIGSGAAPPFGVLRAEGAGRRVTLWRDYEAADGVGVTDDGLAVFAVGIETPIDPGETIRREYDLRRSPPVGAPLAAGDYTVAGKLGYSHPDRDLGPGTRVQWAVSFSVVGL